jgi:hypothetical protein
MPTKYYEDNWRILLMILLTIACFFGLQGVKTINHYAFEFKNSNHYTKNISGNLNIFLDFNIKSTHDAISKAYNLIYLKIFNVPVVFWFLTILNIFLALSLKLTSIKNLSLNLLSAHHINKQNNIKTHYLNFYDFISSSYGAVSISAISEIIILIKNYNTPGSIFWVCATITMLGIVQLCEIILNCNYVENEANDQSCFVCAFQYLTHKSAAKKNKKKSTKAKKFVGIYGFLMIIVSFFGATRNAFINENLKMIKLI